ncbi:CDK-activating kinase assembly factor MAT1, partial [Phenoliferia sp. Uapishka_3]
MTTSDAEVDIFFTRPTRPNVLAGPSSDIEVLPQTTSTSSSSTKRKRVQPTASTSVSALKNKSTAQKKKPPAKELSLSSDDDDELPPSTAKLKEHGTELAQLAREAGWKGKGKDASTGTPAAAPSSSRLPKRVPVSGPFSIIPKDKDTYSTAASSSEPNHISHSSKLVPTSPSTTPPPPIPSPPTPRATSTALSKRSSTVVKPKTKLKPKPTPPLPKSLPSPASHSPSTPPLPPPIIVQDFWGNGASRPAQSVAAKRKQQGAELRESGAKLASLSERRVGMGLDVVGGLRAKEVVEIEDGDEDADEGFGGYETVAAKSKRQREEQLGELELLDGADVRRKFKKVDPLFGGAAKASASTPKASTSALKPSTSSKAAPPLPAAQPKLFFSPKEMCGICDKLFSSSTLAAHANTCFAELQKQQPRLPPHPSSTGSLKILSPPPAAPPKPFHDAVRDQQKLLDELAFSPPKAAVAKVVKPATKTKAKAPAPAKVDKGKGKAKAKELAGVAADGRIISNEFVSTSDEEDEEVERLVVPPPKAARAIEIVEDDEEDEEIPLRQRYNAAAKGKGRAVVAPESDHEFEAQGGGQEVQQDEAEEWENWEGVIDIENQYGAGGEEQEEFDEFEDPGFNWEDLLSQNENRELEREGDGEEEDGEEEDDDDEIVIEEGWVSNAAREKNIANTTTSGKIRIQKGPPRDESPPTGSIYISTMPREIRLGFLLHVTKLSRSRGDAALSHSSPLHFDFTTKKSFNLINSLDVEATEARIKQYESENRALIEANLTRGEREAELVKMRDEEDRRQKEEAMRRWLEIDEEERVAKEEERKLVLESLESSTASTSKILSEAKKSALKRSTARSNDTASGTGVPSFSSLRFFANLADNSSSSEEPEDLLAELGWYDGYEERYDLRGRREGYGRLGEGAEGGDEGGYVVEEVWEKGIRSSVAALFLRPVREDIEMDGI